MWRIHDVFAYTSIQDIIMWLQGGWELYVTLEYISIKYVLTANTTILYYISLLHDYIICL
jgi:hypothetical protein